MRTYARALLPVLALAAGASLVGCAQSPVGVWESSPAEDGASTSALFLDDTGAATLIEDAPSPADAACDGSLGCFGSWTEADDVDVRAELTCSGFDDACHEVHTTLSLECEMGSDDVLLCQEADGDLELALVRRAHDVPN
ncbi:MAG TPA: hypothetical protein VL400_00385 [Polyangiaceae bacterium]|jgi:hypothetical protein|nr:hypothetical protein [Polyangiaceae bacterium]